MRTYFYILSLIFIICSCAPTRVVKPLGKGEKAVGASLGGPVVQVPGVTFPLPFTSISYANGVAEDLTAFGGVNASALLFGVLNTDFGVTKGLKTQRGWSPGISVSPIGNFMVDRWEWDFRFYPQLDLNAYWAYGKYDNLIYIGSSNWIDISRSAAYIERTSQRWVPDIHLGKTFSTYKMQYTLELRYLAPFNENDRVIFDYVSFGSKGATGIYFGVVRRF